MVALQSLVSKAELCMCCMLTSRKLLLVYHIHLQCYLADSNRHLRKQGKKAGVPAEACLSSSKACQLFRCRGALAAVAAGSTGIHRTSRALACGVSVGRLACRLTSNHNCCCMQFAIHPLHSSDPKLTWPPSLGAHAYVHANTHPMTHLHALVSLCDSLSSKLHALHVHGWLQLVLHYCKGGHGTLKHCGLPERLSNSTVCCILTYHVHNCF